MYARRPLAAYLDRQDEGLVDVDRHAKLLYMGAPHVPARSRRHGAPIVAWTASLHPSMTHVKLQRDDLACPLDMLNSIAQRAEH
jgi:hypothetical protein